MRLFWYVAVMAGVTYLIRLLPFLFRTKVHSRFFRSFPISGPSAVPGAWTIPPFFSPTNRVPPFWGATTVAMVLAYLEKPLVVVALAAAASVFAAGFFF